MRKPGTLWVTLQQWEEHEERRIPVLLIGTFHSAPLAHMFYLYYTHIMRLTAAIQLLPTAAQADALRRTLEAANAACNYISQVAWQSKTFRQFPIHRLTYQAARETFGLAAQLAVRCIAKVADGYKLDRKTQCTFQPHGAVPYDDRILSYNLKGSQVSIWTLDGRQAIPFVCGDRQRELLVTQRGETDLAFVRGKWYLLAACEVETPEPIDVEGVLGVDLGIVNLATDSDGESFSGHHALCIGLRRKPRCFSPG